MPRSIVTDIGVTHPNNLAVYLSVSGSHNYGINSYNRRPGLQNYWGGIPPGRTTRFIYLKYLYWQTNYIKVFSLGVQLAVVR